MRTLIVLSSILGDNSKSTRLARHLSDHLNAASGEVIVRDLGHTPLPYMDGSLIGALFTPQDQRVDAQHAAVAEADAAIAELMAADRVIFAVPVYNFGLPAQLKSYLDFVARAGVTFRYTAEGVPQGLVTGKEVFVVSARGGKAQGTPLDTVTPYLQTMLGFLGMTDVTFIAAEGQAMGEAAAAAGMDAALAAIDALPRTASAESRVAA